MNAPVQEALRERVHASARRLDERRFEDYLAMYAPQGEYRMEVRAPELETPMVWMAVDRDELGRRLASAASHEWQIYAALELTRLVAVDRIDADGARARTSSTLAAYATDEDGRSSVYAVGRYEDEWALTDGRWLLDRRVLRLATRLLDAPTPLPL